MKTHKILYIYYLLSGLFYLWLLGHESSKPIIWHYSLSYIIFLFVAAVTLILIPITVRFLQNRFSRRELALYSIPIFIATFVAYFIASQVYYHSRQYLYEPFLQNPPVYFPGLKDKDAKTYRILAMGGSTTERSLYPKQLEKILSRKYPGLNIEVLNAGVSFWTTKHSLINYVTYANSFQADMILVMHAINDLVRSCEPPEYSLGDYNDHWSHFYGPTIATAKAKTFDSYLFEHLWLALIYNISGNAYVDYPIEKYRSIHPYKKNLERIARHTRGSGSQLVYITQPSIFKPDLTPDEKRQLLFGPVFCPRKVGTFTREWPSVKSMWQAMAAFNDIVKSVAQDKNVLLIDAANQVERNFNNFIDDVHHSKKGGQLLGSIVAKAIIDAKLIDQHMEQSSQ